MANFNVLVVGTFNRHPVDVEKVVEDAFTSLPKRYGFSGSFTTTEVFVDERAEIDFSDPDYLEKTLTVVRDNAERLALLDFSLVLVNTSGFTPAAMALTAVLVARQASVAERGDLYIPPIFGMHFDRTSGKYQAFELGPYNEFLFDTFKNRGWA